MSNQNLGFLEEAITIRLYQAIINKRNLAGRYQIPIHLAVGHELTAIALRHTFHLSDSLILSHRNLHYQLAFEPDANSILAELELEPEGISKGNYGLMNMINVKRGIIYTSSILGNSFGVACGVALSHRDNRPAVVWVVAGDGAIEEGAFSEALLIAASLGLPICFLIEDNEWSLATHVSERRVPVKLESLCRAYGVEFIEIKNHVYEEILEGMSWARSIAESCAPALIQVPVTTLGGYFVPPGDSKSEKRFVNYHAGAIKAWKPEDFDELFFDNDVLKTLVKQMQVRSDFKLTCTKELVSLSS
jgi:pyruvate dehydrogenase E1 component alpha subunit